MRVRLLTLLVFTFVSACGSTDAERERRPEQVEALSPVKVASQIARARASAATGNQAGTQAAMNELHKDFSRSIRLPDASRKIDKEHARTAAARIDGVRSVVWLDHENLVVMVRGADLRSQSMIDEVCMALEPLGDTLAVVVNVQNVDARNGDEAETLSRNCQLPMGERAMMQRHRQVDAIDPALRRQFKTQQRPRQ